MINDAIKVEAGKGLPEDWYRITGNGRLLGAYYCDQGELVLEYTPVWLPTLKDQIKQEVERVLEVKVQSVVVRGDE